MEVFKMNYIEAYKNKLLKLTNSDIIKEKRWYYEKNYYFITCYNNSV
jgi:hypothetical protein